MPRWCCSSNASDVLFKKAWLDTFPSVFTQCFFPQIQFILQCPPSWRALQLLNLLHLVDRRSMWVRWSGRILNGHVLRRVGLQSEPYVYIYIYKVFSFYTITYIYIYHLLFLHAGSCTCRDGEPFQQRIGDGTGQGPQPVLIESNKMLFLMPFSLFWLWGCFAYASWDCFETICRQGALAVKQSSQVETCHMSGLKFGTDHGLSQQIQAYPFFWPALMWKENKKTCDGPCMQVDAEVKQQSEPMLTHEKHEGNRNLITFFDPFLSTWMSWSELGSTAPATKLKEARVRWNGCATPLRSRGGKHGPLCTSFFLQEEMPAMPAVDAEKAGDVFTNTYFFDIFIIHETCSA